jgi:membrane-associated phospholipid phosphatase
VTRRGVLGAGGFAAIAAQLGTGPSLPAVLKKGAASDEIGPLLGAARVRAALRLRVNAATAEAQIPLPDHPDNGDEDKYADKRGSYSKALPHDGLGEVDPVAYAALITALSSGQNADFEAIPLGSTRKLTSPQAAYAFDLAGPDGHHLAVPANATFDSAERAGEMVEVYWHALTRDVRFEDFGSDPTVAQACADLSAMSDFKGPKVGGAVTPESIFRHSAGVGMVGPYLSQFLWKPVGIGSLTLDQKNAVPVAGDQYGTSYADWLAIQNGVPQAPTPVIDPVRRYLINAHDLAESVHNDPPYQWAIHAALILLGYGPAALSPTNPYLALSKQASFVTWGPPHILDMIARASHAALKSTWFNKWLVHRTLRPEVCAGRVHNHLTGAKAYDLHADVLNSAAAAALFSANGTYLLPLAYPEGSPTHPTYPAGHATFAGATATMLKAFFDENFVIPDPVVPNADGSALVPYSGPALTVRGEADKMASNVSIGRNAAGVHYRADAVESMLLGEQAAIGILRDYKAAYLEPFGSFQFTSFDGTPVVI